MKKFTALAAATGLALTLGVASATDAEARHRRGHAGAAIAGAATAIVGGILLHQLHRDRYDAGYYGYGYPYARVYGGYPYGYGYGYGYADPGYAYAAPRWRDRGYRRDWSDRGWRGRHQYGGYRNYGNPYRPRYGGRGHPEGSVTR